MAKRKLRIVKTTPNFAGICERCGSQFNSVSTDRAKAEAEIAAAFDVHDCQSLDNSQNALRVVRHATEDK